MFLFDCNWGLGWYFLFGDCSQYLHVLRREGGVCRCDVPDTHHHICAIGLRLTCLSEKLWYGLKRHLPSVITYTAFPSFMIYCLWLHYWLDVASGMLLNRGHRCRKFLTSLPSLMSGNCPQLHVRMQKLVMKRWLVSKTKQISNLWYWELHWFFYNVTNFGSATLH